MRRVLAATVGIASLGVAGMGHEKPEHIFEDAAHGITDVCAAEAVQRFDDEYLERLVAQDVETAELQDKPTLSDHHKQTEGYDLSGYIAIGEYINKFARLIQAVELPESHLRFNVYSDQANWRIDPEVLDATLRLVLQSESGDESLRAMSYQCMEETLYGLHALSQRETDVYLLGGGNSCMATDKVIPRSIGICPTWGRFSSRHDRIVVFPRADDLDATASERFMHELWHGLQDYLHIKAEQPVRREFSAYAFQSAAHELLEQTGVYPIAFTEDSCMFAPIPIDC